MPEQILTSAGGDGDGIYSPDGRRIAFSSARGGINNIWLSDADGSHPVQLTNFGSHCGTPRWSPNGRKLVFDSLQNDNWDVYVIDVDGGTPRPLTREAAEDGTATWSRDGRFVYFRSSRGGSLELWKMPSEGGAPVQLTHRGGYYGIESADERFVYYTNRHADAGIWRVLASGGEEEEIVKGPISWENFTVGARGLYYMESQQDAAKTSYAIQYLDLDSGKVSLLFRKEAQVFVRSLTASSDEKWLLYEEAPFGTSELMLVDNFR